MQANLEPFYKKKVKCKILLCLNKQHNTFYVANSHKKILLLVFLFAFFFTAAHFHFAGR